MPDYRKLSEIADDANAILDKQGTAPPPVEDAPKEVAPAPQQFRPLSEIADEANAVMRGNRPISEVEVPSGVHLSTALPKDIAPETMEEQTARGNVATEPVDRLKLAGNERALYDAWVEKETLANRASTAEQTAGDMIQSMRHPRAKEDAGSLGSPFGTATIGGAMRGAATPGSLLDEAGAAIAPKDYSGGRQAHYYRVAQTKAERDIARSLLRSDYLRNGMDPNTADLRARSKYESGAPLLIPTADNPDAQGGAETLEAKGQPLHNSWTQAATDIGVGTAEAAGALAGAAKYATDVSAEVVRAGQNAVGLHAGDDWTDRWTAWNIPSPSEAARDYLASSSNPRAQAAAKRIDQSLRRGAGVMAGLAELHNVTGAAALPEAVADWMKIDPTDVDGLMDAVVQVATARHDNPTPRKTAKDMGVGTLENTAAAVGQLPGRIAAGYEDGATGKRTPIDIGLENAAWGASVLSTPVMDVMGALSTDPTGKETALGWFFRVPTTAASGLVTTQVARMADYGAQHLLGAESYRRNRNPTDEDMTFAEAFLPVILTGSGLHDYLHTVYNGDSLTPEFMRFANTIAYGTPGLSDEWRDRLIPGGSLRDFGIQAAMLGDLALPMDSAPHWGAAAVHGAGRFTEGYRAGRAGGMSRKEAAGLGAAGVVPSLTHRYMMSDAARPEYAAIWGELVNEGLAVQRRALLGQGRPMSEAVDVTRPDADAVYTATARAYARRAIAAGLNPTEQPVAGRASSNTAQRVREMLTTLRVKASDIDSAVRAEGVAAAGNHDPITKRTANTLTSMGYGADDINHIGEAEGRRRIDEGVFPGDVDGSSLDPEVPPTIPELERAAETTYRTARAEDKPPPGRWSEEVSKEADPAHRARLALVQLADYWGVTRDSALPYRALQAALSFYDRNTGQYRRMPLPHPAWIAERINAGKGDHIDTGFRILRDASPEQVWRNVLAFERGETVTWTNDVHADQEATRLSRTIPRGNADRLIREILPPEHPLRLALGEKGEGAVNSQYQKIANAGRDWLAALAADTRALTDSWKGTYSQARTFYQTRAVAAGLDPLLPVGTDLRAALTSLTGRVKGRDVAALASYITRLGERETALVRGQSILDAATRWLAARMEEARPKTHGGVGRSSYRQRVRSDLLALAKKRQIDATPKQVDLYLAVFDRVAKRLADLGVVETPDAWWSRFDVTAGEVDGAKGSIGFIPDGRALITLAADADLSTLFHESGHLLRRLLPAEHMVDIDAYVHERWGSDGWNAVDERGVKVAEEWFARQLEAVFAEGRINISVTDPLTRGGRLLARVNRALRLVADVLTAVYRGLPVPVEPRMRKWVAEFLDDAAAQAQGRIDAAQAVRTERRTDAMRDRDFLVREYPALVDGIEAAARGEERARPAERIVPTVVRAEPPSPDELAGPRYPAVSRTGWGPRMLEEVAADAERIRAIEDPKARLTAIHDWLSGVHGYIGSDKAEGAGRHKIANARGMAVVDQMLAAGRRIVGEMSDAEKVAADTAPKPESAQEPLPVKAEPVPAVDENDLLVAGKLPADPEAGTVVVDAGPVVAPPVEAEAPKPVKPTKAQTALSKLGESFAERMRNRVGPGDSLAAADRIVKAVAKRVAELKGEEAPAPKASMGYLGQPANGFIEGVKAALRDLTDEALGRDGGDLRDARARELAEDFYRRTVGPLEPQPTPPRPAPVIPDALLEIEPPRPVEIPPGVDKEKLIATTVPPRGSPHMDEAGFPRSMVDERGFSYRYRIARMKLGELFTSHTPGLAWREGYDHAFQNRPDAFQRAGWIEKVAQTFNAESAARPNGDTPTMGAVTVWMDPQGRAVVVAGNGRTLAMVELHRQGMAGQEPYAGLLAQLQERTGGWSRALGMGVAAGDEIMVRVLDGATYEEAVRFAQNSQGVPSVPVADGAIVTGTAQKLRVANPNRKIAIDTVPAEWNAATVRSMVEASPDLWATLQEVGWTNESWAATLTKDFPAALASVLGVFASTMPERILDAASRSSEKMVNAVAMAGPSVALILSDAERSEGLRNADIVGAFADGVDLYLTATKSGAKTAEAIANVADEARRQYAPLSGVKVLPVSQMSYAVAAAIQRLVSPTNASGTGLASLFRSAAQEVAVAMAPTMFAAPTDPVVALVDALAGDAAAVKKGRESFPATHGEAVEYARQLEVAAIEANQAMRPVVVEPPGYVDVLKQERESRPLQTDTPEFKAWFGASKVVDENGAPARVYHGTDRDFPVFAFHHGINAPVHEAAYFSDVPGPANTAAGFGYGAPQVLPVYLKMERPLVVDAAGRHAIELTDEIGAAMRDQRARGRAYDGVIIRNVREFQADALTTTYAVLAPEQIKSAIANRGTFDPTNPNILFQHRDYTDALSPTLPGATPRGPIPAGHTVTRVDPGVDSAPWFNVETSSAYAAKVSKMRAVSQLTREQLNLALGYTADRSTYDARDLAERTLAAAMVQPLQGTAWRGDYRSTPGRIAIPRQRVAAVRARAMVVLGDLQAEVAEAMRTRPVPTAEPMLGEHIEAPLNLTTASATKIRAILDYLDSTGWSDSIGTHIRTMTVPEIAERMTQPEYIEIVGAIHDSVSGAAPFRQRPDQFSLASNLVWYWFQRPGALFTPTPLEPDANTWEQFLNGAVGVMGGAVLNAAYILNPTDGWQPDMPAHIRPVFDRFRRDIGSMPTRLVERIEDAVGAKGPGALITAIESILPELPGFVAHIDVSPNPTNPGGVSNLTALRNWLYEPAPGVVPGTDWIPHDQPRTAPMMWQEVYGRTDLLVDVLSGNGRRRADPLTLRLIEGLRNRSLTSVEAELVIGKAWSALHSAERIGINILTSAAGQEGAKTSIETTVRGSPQFSGIAIDAYEAFYQGTWAADPVGTRVSVEDMAIRLGVARTVKTHLWLAETLNRLNVEAKVEQFADNLIDHQYVHDITQMAGAAGAVPNDTMHALMLSREVADAVSATMWGTNYVSGMTAGMANIHHVTVPNLGYFSPEAQGAARVIIAQTGMRPDLLSYRRGVKGELPVSGMANAMAALSADPEIRAQQLRDPSFWRDVGSKLSPSGRDFYANSVMAEHIAGMVERHAPVGDHLAAILSQRNGAKVVWETLMEGMQLLKGSMITGGTNGILAAAVMGGAMIGGAPILSAAALGGAMWALAVPLRLSGYVNNAIGAVLQGSIELGWGNALRSVGDRRLARLAYKASWETVQYRKMGTAIDAAGRAAGALRDMVSGRPASPENTVVLSPDGTVWSIADIVRGATQYGLDGTMARFESSERIAHSYDRMAARYESSLAMRSTWGMITSFFGRYTLNENYRRMYEHVDTYFRYLWLIRGIQEGLPFDQAVTRSLRISFDYTETAAVDRAVNQFFLFWMYQRRALDLTMAALIEHPHTVLGLIRYMRAQDLTSGYSDTDDDYVRQTETVPDYAMLRPSIPGVAWLPVVGGNNAAIKPLLVEPPQATAIKILSDMSTGNVLNAAGRLNPVGLFAVNSVEAMAGGEMISFFRKRPVADSDYVIPNRLVMWDQQVTGGALLRSFGARPYYVEDPSRQAAPGAVREWRVGGSYSNRLAYDAFRTLVAGAGPMLTAMDVSDKSGDLTDEATLWFLQHLQAPPVDGIFTPATDEQARPAMGPFMEFLRGFGVAPGFIRSEFAAREQPTKDYAQAVAGQLKAVTAENNAANPTPSRPVNIGPKPINPDKDIGVNPDETVGVEK